MKSGLTFYLGAMNSAFENWEMVYHFRGRNLNQLPNILKTAFFFKKTVSFEKDREAVVFDFSLKEGLNKGDYILEARESDSWECQLAKLSQSPLKNFPAARISAVKIQDSKVSLASDLWELSFFGKDVWFSVYKLKPNTNNP